MSKRLLLAILLSLIFILAFSSTSASAQGQASCVAQVLSAITQTSTRCATIGIDSACYGHDNVRGSFLEENEPDVFTKVAEEDQDFFLKPGDQADLLLTEAIQTGALDLFSRPATWGISVMNVQASLPNEVIEFHDGRGLIYYLLGGVEVEDDIEPEDVLELLPAGIPVTTIAAADMRIAPIVHDTATSTNVLDRVPAAATVNADAITPNGAWVRVVFEERPGWISRATLPQDADLSDLVEIGPEDYTPMQSFFFRNGILNDVRRSECALAPSFLFVQGPQDVPVDLRVHCVDIRLESSAVLRTRDAGDEIGEFFEIAPLFGLTTIFPDTDEELLVPPGFVARLLLGELTSLGIEDDIDEKCVEGLAGPIRLLTDQELAELAVLETLPPNLLHDVPEVPTRVRPSGVGGVIDRIIFNNPRALRTVRQRCEDGTMPPQVCEILGLP